MFKLVLLHCCLCFKVYNTCETKLLRNQNPKEKNSWLVRGKVNVEHLRRAKASHNNYFLPMEREIAMIRPICYIKASWDALSHKQYLTF